MALAERNHGLYHFRSAKLYVIVLSVTALVVDNSKMNGSLSGSTFCKCLELKYVVSGQLLVMGKTTNIATSQSACEIMPGQTDLYLRNRAPQKSPQIKEAMRSIKFRANMWMPAYSNDDTK